MAQPVGTQRESSAAIPATQSQERRVAPTRQQENPRGASDDEILGISSHARVVVDRAQKTRKQFQSMADQQTGKNPSTDSGVQDKDASPDATVDAEPVNLRAIFEANPDLRRSWHEANAYRKTFATPEEARTATAALADLNRMDALFFSRSPEDHAQLAQRVAELDPAAFQSLANAMNDLSAQRQSQGKSQAPPARPENQPIDERPTSASTAQNAARSTSLSPAQAEFFQAANAAAVESVIGAIESQVERLLPEGVSKTARNRVVGEIYRELDAAMRSNRQLAQQVREAFRSGGLDAEHQRGIVSLITGRARQALPGVAKRVLNEWTSTVVAASHDRRARQRSAERRVDIAGSGGAGNNAPRTLSPREIDYARMSDGDILNL